MSTVIPKHHRGMVLVVTIDVLLITYRPRMGVVTHFI
jgi:hypothetical protein